MYLCEILDCQPGDIVEYIQDETWKKNIYVLYYIYKRGKPESGYPQIISKLFLQTAVTTANSGGYFRFSLKIV
jgi:hypothetical protein